MRTKVTLIAIMVMLLSSFMVGPVHAQSPIVNQLTDIPVTGTVDGGGVFEGTFSVKKFHVEGNQIVAVGTLTGVLQDTAKGTREVSRTIKMPVSFDGSTAQGAAVMQTAQCTILDLYLGPLDLTLLGLRVQLNQVHLQITGVDGLLGDLLCSINDLLDGGLGGVLNQIANLLNQILGILS